MAEKILNFFKKKKLETKFKLAGPGHKLSEATITSQSSSGSRNECVSKRSGLSAESKVAAEAALARVQQKRDNPGFNTSYAAIQVSIEYIKHTSN